MFFHRGVLRFQDKARDPYHHEIKRKTVKHILTLFYNFFGTYMILFCWTRFGKSYFQIEIKNNTPYTMPCLRLMFQLDEYPVFHQCSTSYIKTITFPPLFIVYYILYTTRNKRNEERRKNYLGSWQLQNQPQQRFEESIS